MSRSDSKRLVAHMIDELPPDGAERLIADVLKHRSDEFNYAVVCLIRGGVLVEELERQGVRVTILGRRHAFDFSLLLRLMSWMRAHRPAVVHTHLFTADLWGRLAAFLTGVPAVFSTVHNVEGWRTPVHRWIERLFARRANRVIACSDEVEKTLLRRIRVQLDAIAMVPNGIDLSRVENASVVDLTREFGLSPDQCSLGVIGRLHPNKGHLDFLPVLAELRDQGLQFHCLFVGEGESRTVIANEVKRLGLTRQVTLTGLRRDVPGLLHALDAIVMPSRWEGLPIAMLESMAAGKAVVATAVGGIPSVLRDGINGRLVPAGDRSALKAAVTEIITRPDRRAVLGRAAREYVYAHHDVRHTARAYEGFYREALAFRRGA